jgi:hypothetical protein
VKGNKKEGAKHPKVFFLKINRPKCFMAKGAKVFYGDFAS